MSRRPTTFLALLIGAALLVGCGSDGGGAAEAEAPADGLQVVAVTADEPPIPEQAALRFVIVNGTTEDDVLQSVSTEVAAATSIHESSIDGGMARMTPRDSVPVVAGARVTFAPGGLHVMLEDLKQPLAVGDTFPVTLHFEHAGDVEVTAEVVEPGSVTADDLEHAHG